MRRTQAANVAAVAAIEKRPVKHMLPNVAAVDHLGSSSASRSLFASSRVDPTGGSAKEAWLRCRAACRLLSAITLVRNQCSGRLAVAAAGGRRERRTIRPAASDDETDNQGAIEELFQSPLATTNQHLRVVPFFPKTVTNKGNRQMV